MTFRKNHLTRVCLLMALSTFANGASTAVLGAKAITGNQYFQRAIQASTQMITVLTIAIPVTGPDVTPSINKANLGLAVAGWTLVAQSSIEREGTTTQILLTYRKLAPAT